MSQVMVFRHAPHEGLGGLEEMLGERGLVHQYVDLWQCTSPREVPSLGNAAGLILLGGPMSVNDTREHPWLEAEILRIQVALARNPALPVLGICLGSQLLAKAIGGAVYPNPRGKEIGWYPVTTTEEAVSDPILRHFEPEETVLHWHGEIFDLPESAVVLARSERSPIQAFRVGETAWGLLFHIEVDRDEMGAWLEDEEMRREAEQAGVLEAVRAGASEGLRGLERLRQEALGAFLNRVTLRVQ